MAPNYASAKLNTSRLRKHIAGEVAAGRMVAMSRADATKKYGSLLRIAAMGCVDKGTSEDGVQDFRLIHDGTHWVLVNAAVK